ncbi:hypothetical protein GW764_03860 [Candidatus Parcubacteria bacterium]|nr:hypothetical protein [Candidatus Parcubacteria bacterium]
MKNKINKISKKISNVINSFSFTEKIVFYGFALIFIISSIVILANINNKFLVEIPDNGGRLTEGVIGTPRFINPVIANSNVDKDITALIYSGLTKIDKEGQVTPDLADRYEISEDGLTYDFYLRSDATFHDKKLITADDVIFTILKVQDPLIRSPKISDWERVTIEKVSDRQIRFILDEPRPNFIKKTDIGILPKHLWQQTPNDAFSLSLYNISPIGSGPYKIDKIKKDSIDIPISYILESNNAYTLGEPLIKKIIFKFAKNENELVEMIENNEIDSISGLSPNLLENISTKDLNTYTSTLPRVFGLFINQDESPALSINSARKALEKASPKKQIVDDIFNGYAEIINNPITGFDEEDFSQDLEEAENILIEAGWEKNEEGIYTIETSDETFVLSTSISTSNIPELVSIAELVAREWKKIGIDVSVKIFDTNDLNQNVIRPRNFEILLFGTIVETPSDLYSFWHSSRRNDPGLNITNYTNIEADTILEELTSSLSKEDQAEKINELNEEIKSDTPAIFLYSPKFTYLISNKVKGIEIEDISSATDRFRNIDNWFINTDKVWEIFNN